LFGWVSVDRLLAPNLPVTEASAIDETFRLLSVVAGAYRKKYIRMVVFHIRPEKFALIVCYAYRVVVKNGAIEESFLSSRIDKGLEIGRRSGCSSCTMLAVSFVSLEYS
jgi:hypothetical protein